MAEGQHKVIKVKSTNIKQIFNTMEYGEISDNTDLAKTWLEKQKKTIYGYIDKKKKGSKGQTIAIQDVNNGESLATVYSPKIEDVEKIIAPSVENKWRLMKPIKRGILLESLAREIQRNSTLFCQLEISARGILSTDTKTKALPLLVEYLQYYASWAVKYSNENQENWETEGRCTVSIISYSSFLAVFGFVLGPALAAGYEVVLQTEPRISLVAALIIELAESIGIPEGTIKLLPGIVDPHLIFSCVDVRVISRFGNLFADKYHNITIPFNMKFLAIRNGKIPMIVFNNGDLDSACDSVIDSAWGYLGWLPWSVNTVLVQEDVFPSFVDKLKHRLSQVKMGRATDKMADLSCPVFISNALSPEEQLQEAINEAKLQGIEIFQSNQSSKLFQPTLLIGGKLFGNNVILEDNNLPVVTVLAFRTSNEAINLANNSRCGFGASVWTEKIGLANEVARKLNVGNVWINTHGNFTATVSMTPWKQSGFGYFGGQQGFFEYIDTDMISPEIFKNSINDVHNHPTGQDLQNAITTAKKGHEVWNKMSILMRSRLLRKVAEEIISTKKFYSEDQDHLIPELDKWVSAIYEGVAQMDNLDSVSKQKSYELKCFREAVGIIGVEGDCRFINLIVGALLLGNSVIILNTTFLNCFQYAVEICKIFSASSIPAGVFNVILNSNQAVLNEFVAFKELNVYFALTYNETLNKIKVRDLKYIHRRGAKWRDILVNTTKVKNVWSDIGDSVL